MTVADMDRVIAHLSTWPALATEAYDAHPYPVWSAPPELPDVEA